MSIKEKAKKNKVKRALQIFETLIWGQRDVCVVKTIVNHCLLRESSAKERLPDKLSCAHWDQMTPWTELLIMELFTKY